MNKYQAADHLAEQLLINIKETNKLEIILRQAIKQAFIEGVEYGRNESKICIEPKP